MHLKVVYSAYTLTISMDRGNSYIHACITIDNHKEDEK